MRFSIIIPAHNAEDRISTALDSVVSQRLKDYELIVACDSCEDNTADIARSYGATVVECEHHRDGLTRDEGLNIAKGEYVMFMDDDDYWLHSHVLEVIDSYLLAYKEIGVVVDVLAFGFYWEGLGLRFPLDANRKLLPNVWSKVWRRDAISNTRFGDAYSISDFQFTNAMFAKDLKVRTINDILYYYNYMRPGSLSDINVKIGFDGGNNIDK